MHFFSSSVFFTLLGTVAGSLLTFVFQYLLSSRNMSLRLKEKSLNTRFDAYHKVLKELKALDAEDFHLSYVNSDGGSLFYPKFFDSIESFDDQLKSLQETWYENEYLFTKDVYEAFFRVEIYLLYVKKGIREGKDFIVMPLLGYWLNPELSELVIDCVDIIEYKLENMISKPLSKIKETPLPDDKVEYSKVVKESMMETRLHEYISLLQVNGIEVKINGN